MSARFIKPRRGARAEGNPAAHLSRPVLDALPHMAWIARADGTVKYLNKRILEYTGSMHGSLEGWGWRTMVHPDDWERCVARWTKAFTKGQPYEVEYRLRRRDGRYLWHLGAAMPMREGGRIESWVGTCTDIESQKRAERLLEKARQTLGALVSARAQAQSVADSRFHSLVESAPAMVWESGLDKLCTYFSEQWLQFTGRTAEQEMGVGWAEGVHPEDLERCLATYNEAFDARRPFEMKYRLRRRDGRYRWVSDRGVPCIDPTLGFRGYIGSCVDVTEQLEQQERLRAFMDSIPAVAWIKDSKLRVVWASARYARILGKPLETMLGQDDYAIWPAEMAQQFRHNDEKALRVNGPMQNLASTPSSDGSIVHWLTVRFPFPDDTGAPGVAGIAFDVTAGYAAAGGAAAAGTPSPVERLSARERQVLQMIVDGMTSAEVGERLSLSPKSVDTYRSRLMAKLGLPDLPALVKFAIRHGLTTSR